MVGNRCSWQLGGRLPGWLAAAGTTLQRRVDSNHPHVPPCCLLPATRSAGDPPDDDSWRDLWSGPRDSGGVCGCHAGLHRRLPHSAVSAAGGCCGRCPCCAFPPRRRECRTSCHAPLACQPAYHAPTLLLPPCSPLSLCSYVARDRVQQFAASNPKFAAIDKAIGRNGFRVVALLRLSPLLPLAASNYL